MTKDDELLKRMTRRIMEGLTPKEVKVLDRLRLSTKEIAKELGDSPGTIAQVLNVLYGKFNPIIDFDGTTKKVALMEEWQRLRRQYKFQLPGEQGEEAGQ